MIEYISKEVARRIIDSGRTKWQMLAVLDSAVPADVRENKYAEWVFCGGSFRCSECASMPEFKDIRRLHFCPNCGSQMREEVEE